MEPKRVQDSITERTEIILPSDSNALGSAFGGKVMQWIDVCAAIAAQRYCRKTVVTASMDDLHFHAAVKLGWNVTLKARVLAAFKTSVEVGVTVTAENPLTGERQLTTSALLTFVALDEKGTKTLVPPLKLESEQERVAVQEAHARREERIARRNQGQSWLALLGE